MDTTSNILAILRAKVELARALEALNAIPSPPPEAKELAAQILRWIG